MRRCKCWALALVIAALAVGCSGGPDDDGPDAGNITDGTGDCEATAERGRRIVDNQCLDCHSEDVEGMDRAGAPSSLNFDTDEQVATWRERIRSAAVDDRTMPPADPLDACEAEALGTYLGSLDGSCEPDCSGRACGPDGCGGTCGSCGGGEVCEEGSCVCEPQCGGRECGPDSCGGSCGTCDSGQTCDDSGQCVDQCTPDCDGRVCGPDGCGGTCGSCETGQTCDDSGQCVCEPDCENKQCGPDGCGGSCGSCSDGQVCNTQENQCVDECTPNCDGRECGTDGCGGSCGSCDSGQTCNDSGQCVCEPDCTNKQCGPDGCGGSCGSCNSGETCDSNGQCVCEPDCTNKDCGPDGCGGSCGSCNTGEMCDSTGQCVCEPDCSNKNCGPDGCGGSCGSCNSGETCDSGSCVATEVSLSGDVMPIFDNAGCAGSRCHGGTSPAEGLDLSSASAAHADMVGVSSNQCSNRLIVEAGSASNSYLIDKLEGTNLCFGSQMPKGGAALSTSEIDTVRTWIDQGAKNN